MAIETEKALIVPGSIRLEECAAGFVYAGACELGKLTVSGPGHVNIEHLQASKDYAKTQAPQIDVAAGFMLCRKIEWPYPTIDCLQLAYVEWPIRTSRSLPRRERIPHLSSGLSREKAKNDKRYLRKHKSLGTSRCSKNANAATVVCRYNISESGSVDTQSLLLTPKKPQ
jgi:hypothetical protein